MANDSGSGAATDAQGRTAADPTENVRELVEAEKLRQDGLREMESRHQTEMRDKESNHVREIVSLRAQYDEELRKAETARIDAIRAVDVAAGQQAQQVSATQATTLAGQVAQAAEAMRTQVAGAATAAVTGLAAALEPIQKDIADLRRAQYEAQGQKTQTTEGSTAGRSMAGLVIAAAVGFSGFLLGIVSIVLAVVLR
jgi:hypothetical protein